MGKLRHIETNQFWVQEKIRKGEVEVIKVATWQNLADTLTKYVNRYTIGKFMKCTSARIESGRHELMPALDGHAEEEEEWRIE